MYASSTILVLVEVALEGWVQDCKHHSNSRNQFSQRDPFGAILVLVEVALEEYSTQKSPINWGVSILVLVEVALEAVGSTGVFTRAVCFNPCSRGSSSGSLLNELQPVN